MKKILCGLAMLAMMSIGAMAQVTPPAAGLYLFNGTDWTPDGNASGYGSISYTPAAFAAYCYNGTAWTPCTSNGGSIPGGVLGSSLYQSAPGVTALTSANTSTSTLCLTETGTGTVGAAPVWGSCAGSAATAFSAITGSTNTSAAMLVGTGASLGPTGTGTIIATGGPGGAFGTGAYAAAYTLPGTVVQTNQVNTFGAYLQSFTNGINLLSTTSPLEFAGSAGTSGQCPISGGAGVTPSWGSCGSGSSGFPITLGSTSIAASSTTTTVAGLTIDGVTPTTMAFVDPTSSIQTQLNGKQSTLTNPVIGPGSGATVGHLAVMGNTAGTTITDGGAVPTLSSLGGVPTTTTVNGHALSSNVVVSASDLTTGTLPHAQLPTLLSADIPNNAANTSGTAANLSGTPALPNGVSATTQTVGDNTTKLATDAFVLANGSSYTLPAATSSTLGGVKPDGTTISNTSGAIAVTTPVNATNVVAAIAGQVIAPSQVNINGVPIGGPDTRPNLEQTTGKTGAIAPNGTFQVFNIAAGNAGTITYLHLTVGANYGDIPNYIQNSTLQIACDGGLVVVPLSTFFLSQDTPQVFTNDQIGISQVNYPNSTASLATYSFNRRVYINYTNGCTITMTNPSASTSAYIFFDTSYKSGTWSGAPAAEAHWNAYPTYFASVPPNTSNPYNYPQISLLPTNTYTGGGQLESMTMYVNSGANYQYLEGTPVVTADSATAVIANGGEDFWGCGYYCDQGLFSIHEPRWGLLIGTSGFIAPTSANDFLGYRFFTYNPGDYVLFNSTLSVSANNGANNYGAPGNVLVKGLVTYFTTNPTTSLVQFGLTANSYYASGTTLPLTAYPTGSTICYTNDGTTPTAPTAGTCSGGTTQTYSSPITLTGTATTITAIATKASYNNSPPVVGIYGALSYTLPTYVSQCANTASSGGTTTVSCALTVTAGDLIVQYCRGATVSSYTASSSPSNTFHGLGLTVGAAGNNGEAFYSIGVASGSTTFSCGSGGTASYQGVQVLQYHPGSVTAFSTGATNGIGVINTTYTSTAINAISPQGLIVSCTNSEYGYTSFTAGTIGSTAANGRSMTSTANIPCEDLMYTSPKTGAAATITTASAGSWDGAILVFN